MKKLFTFFLLAIILISISCQRINPPPKGGLEMIKISDLKGIPSDYGSLISVTTQPRAPNWAQLWFQDDDGTIRLVRIKFPHGISEEVGAISRY